MKLSDLSRTPVPAGDRRERGFASLLIVVYGILAFAATGRATWELFVKFDDAPLPYALSLVAACTYLLVTVLLVRGGGESRAALWVCSIELLGILVVGTLTLFRPHLFDVATVWSMYGIGYGFVPLVLPIAAIIYLRSIQRRPDANAASGTAEAGTSTSERAPRSETTTPRTQDPRP